MGIAGKHVLKAFGEFKDIKVRCVEHPILFPPDVYLQALMLALLVFSTPGRL